MRKSGRPDLRWGGVRGGGRRYFTGYVLEHTVDIRRVAQIAASAAWLDGRPTPPSATRQRDTKFHGSMSGYPRTNCSPLRWKAGASDGFRHVEDGRSQ